MSVVFKRTAGERDARPGWSGSWFRGHPDKYENTHSSLYIQPQTTSRTRFVGGMRMLGRVCSTASTGSNLSGERRKRSKQAGAMNRLYRALRVQAGETELPNPGKGLACPGYEIRVQDNYQARG